MPITSVQTTLSVIGNPLFLSNHAFGGLPDFVGGVGHAPHFLSLGIGGNGQIVSVLRPAMNFIQLPSSENAVDNRGYRSQASKDDDQLIVNRHGSPFLPEGALFPGTAILAGIACIGVGCYWLVLGVCFGFRRGHLVAAATVLLFGIALFNIGLWLLLYNKKDLTPIRLCNTFSLMANVLSAEKQTAIIAALAEGSSIRSIERITGVHRDTIMRLGVRVGNGCELLMDSKMQDLDCNYLQFDELWGFIGKKERHVSVDDNPELGDVWTYCAIDSETKLVPSFKVGKRNLAITTEFVQDVASRMRHRVQVSSDAMHSYIEAMERGFGADVDYGQCVKVYVHDSAQHPERKYSAPHFASAVRRPIAGKPEMEFVSTSHVERLNATTRLHVKRLSRLTLAFSKKLDNFKAAVALHFAYYNFVKRHGSLRMTPAMAAGIERDFWSVGDLVRATL
jgi:IS1 family transposase